MIRINYGTPWSGDLDQLRGFFPPLFHDKLVFGGLTELIEALSPFSDEPTDAGLSAPSLSSIKRELEDKTAGGDNLEITVSLDEVTTDLPAEVEPQTITVRFATT